MASNSDKPTLQHSLDETVYILFCSNASRRIRFSLNGDPHECVRRHDLLRQCLHNPAFWESLWWVAGSKAVLCFVPCLRPSAAGRRIGQRTGRLLRRRSHADSDRGRILRLAVLNPMWFEGALRTPRRMRDKTVGAGRRPPPAPLSERFSSCSSRWSQPSPTPSPARESDAHIRPERPRGKASC